MLLPVVAPVDAMKVDPGVVVYVQGPCLQRKPLIYYCKSILSKSSGF